MSGHEIHFVVPEKVTRVFYNSHPEKRTMADFVVASNPRVFESESSGDDTWTKVERKKANSAPKPNLRISVPRSHHVSAVPKSDAFPSLPKSSKKCDAHEPSTKTMSWAKIVHSAPKPRQLPIVDNVSEPMSEAQRLAEVMESMKQEMAALKRHIAEAQKATKKVSFAETSDIIPDDSTTTTTLPEMNFDDNMEWGDMMMEEMGF